MQGELAQYVALATHTTAWLRNQQAAAPGLDGAHSVLRFVGSITFEDCPGIDAWMRHLAGEGVTRVWLVAPQPDPADAHSADAPYRSVAFAGGLQAGLLATGGSGNRLWRARWQVGDREAPQRRIWAVSYRSGPVPFGPPRLDVPSTAGLLDRALRRAAEFAGRQGLDPWGEQFADACRHWSGGGSPQRVYHGDLFPALWPDPDSRRLTDMAQAGWVFGGMGSWNDLGFPDAGLQREYEEISFELFAALICACIAAVNTER